MNRVKFKMHIIALHKHTHTHTACTYSDSNRTWITSSAMLGRIQWTFAAAHPPYLQLLYTRSMQVPRIISRGCIDADCNGDALALRLPNGLSEPSGHLYRSQQNFAPEHWIFNLYYIELYVCNVRTYVHSEWFRFEFDLVPIICIPTYIDGIAFAYARIAWHVFVGISMSNVAQSSVI